MAEAVGRFAPSPTGDLHLGSALALLAAWARARTAGGRFLWRIEDIDGPRVVPGAAERQQEDARWLGLDWDGAPVRQSARGPLYQDALRRLAALGRLYPCRVSRRELREIASAPHGAPGLPPFPAALRPDAPPGGWTWPLPADAALRFQVDGPPVAFQDGVVGRVVQDVAADVGDVVLRRRDGVVAYQLAVVVDDLAQGVTEVVRGRDLLPSTARQIALARALGGPVPRYAHVPLVVAPDGDKLSKRDGALSLRALREAGARPEAVVAWLAGALGQAARTRADLAAGFDLARVPDRPQIADAGLAGRLVAASGGTP